MLTLTPSTSIFSRDCCNASAEPWTSALRTMSTSFMFSFFIVSNKLSKVTCWTFSRCFSKAFLARCSPTLLAVFSSSKTTNLSAASGTSFKPVISTGVDGVAFFTLRPLSLVITRTRPNVSPTTIGSPTFNVPCWTKISATEPRPLSRRASITVPIAFWSGSALSSMTSAWSKIICKSSSTFLPVLAEILTKIVSPPQSSGTKPYFISCSITWSGFAPGLSILFTATIIGTPALLAWSIASIVCGITPSSAATTKITISVISAPRARIFEKAACPGVSKKVIKRSSILTW